jgi:CRP/FNR family transcriptional regulator
MRLDFPARTVVHRSGDAARCGLVVTGLLRHYLVSTDGREMTMRYGTPGVLAGAVVTVAGPTPTWAQAVVDTTALILDVEKVRAAALANAEVAWALATEMGRAHRELLRAIADTAFGSIRQRLARHLLDLAMSDGRSHDDLGPHLVVRVTQQELADAVGSVREVVARALREMRDEGLVESRGTVLILRDPIRLGEEADVEL